MTIVEVNAGNIDKHGFFCIKNKKDIGYQAKYKWCIENFEFGLKILIAYNDEDKPIGFIEFIDGENAWRPVSAANYYFIHCLWVYPKKNLGLGVGTALLDACYKMAGLHNKFGVAVVTSEGPWMSGSSIYLRNGFKKLQNKDRFELLVKKYNPSTENPSFIDWDIHRKKYQNWNLVYSDQCPYHSKSCMAILEESHNQNIEIEVKHLKTAFDAQKAPSGFGGFNLMENDVVYQDHYISKRRFQNIIKNRS